MANGEVGRLSLRVLPDTSQFRRDLRKAAKRAARTIQPELELTAELSRASLARVKRQLDGIRGEVEVAATVATGAKHDIKESLEDVDATVEVNADLDHGAASSKLAAFTRPRSLPINLKVTKASLAKVTTALAALSGARVLGDSLRGVKDMVTGLDRAVPRLATVTTALGTLSAAALAGGSNLLGVASSLAAIAPAALALPGIFMGFAVGGGVMIAALKDIKKVLGDLGPSFSALQDKISTNFWAKAEGPIRSLATKAMPLLQREMSAVATEIGGFFASVSTALSSDLNMGYLQGIFRNLRDSIDIASEGIAWMVDAFMNLANVGSAYLPRLASWFNQISESFAGWVAENAQSGDLFAWIDNGIVELKNLGRALAGMGGILAGFANAAQSAGGSSLGVLADGLQRVSAAVNGPMWQGALSQIFEGAHRAMEGLAPGVAALGDAFVDLGPAISEVLSLVGDTAGTALAAFATAFQQPAFQGGIVAFFEGVKRAVEQLAPALPALGDAFGALAGFAGTFAGVLGGVFGAAIESLAPAVSDLMGALKAVANVIGGALTAAIQAVGPAISQIVSVVAGWIRQNPALASTVLALVAGLGSLVAALVPVVGAIMSAVTAIASFVSAVMPAVTAIVGFVGGWSSLLAILGTAAAAIGAVVAVVGAIAAALVYAWQTSEQFREAVSNLGRAVLAALRPVVDFVMGTVWPTIRQVGQAFMSMVKQVLDALTPMMTTIVNIATQIIQVLTPVVGFVMDTLAPVFTFLGDVVAAAFTYIGSVVSAGINVITSILQVFLAVIQGDWSGAWLAIKNVMNTVWQSIKTIMGASLTFIKTVFTSALNALKSIWGTVWNTIKSVASNIWSGIKSLVSSAINGVKSTISNVVNGIRVLWSSGWNAIKTTTGSIWGGIKSLISGAINAVKSTISTVMNGIRSFILGTWNGIKSTFSGALSSIRSVVSSGMSSARSMFANAMNGIRNTVNSGINGVMNFFRQLPGRITGALGGLTGRLTAIGRNMMQGLINGVRALGGRLTGVLKGIVDSAIRSVKSLLGIHSPSRVFMQIGEYTGDGMVKGLQHRAHAVANAMDRMVAPPSVQDFGNLDSVTGVGSTPSITINQYNPVARRESALRDDVANSMRLAAAL